MTVKKGSYGYSYCHGYVPVSTYDFLGRVTGHLEEPGTGVKDRVIGFCSIRNHESLLERRQGVLQVLRDSRDPAGFATAAAVGGVAGVSGVPPGITASAAGAGGSNRHSLRLPGLRVRLEDQAPLGGSLRCRAGSRIRRRNGVLEGHPGGGGGGGGEFVGGGAPWLGLRRPGFPDGLRTGGVGGGRVEDFEGATWISGKRLSHW